MEMMSKAKWERSQHKKYRPMVRDLMSELTKVWGREKFLEWWQSNILVNNDKFYWDYKSLYLALKEEHDQLEMLYNQFFGEETSQEYHARVLYDVRPE